MAVPFYIVFASESMGLTGRDLGVLTVVFTFGGLSANLIFGFMADRTGFRLVLLISLVLWILTTLTLLISTEFWVLAIVYLGLGAAFQGFQASCNNLTLEFGNRVDLAMKIGLANSLSELCGGLGVVMAGGIAYFYSFEILFIVSMGFLAAGAILTWLTVPEPRHVETIID